MSAGAPRSSLLARLRHWRDDPRVVAWLDTPTGRLLQAVADLGVRDRALTLAGQAFIALVPLVIVLATWLSAEDGRAVGDWLVRRYGLEGSTAEAVELLFDRPPETASGVSLLGLAILLISVNSFARTLQRTYEVAWDVPPRAPRRAPNRLASLLLLVVLLVALGWLTTIAQRLPLGGTLLGVPLQLAVAVPAWLLVADLLLSHRVAWSLLVPGAVISSVAQVLSTWGGSLWVPLLIERNTDRYGVVGVAVAMISWLVAPAFLAVVCATAGAWAGPMVADRLEVRSGRGDDPR